MVLDTTTKTYSLWSILGYKLGDISLYPYPLYPPSPQESIIIREYFSLYIMSQLMTLLEKKKISNLPLIPTTLRNGAS